MSALDDIYDDEDVIEDSGFVPFNDEVFVLPGEIVLYDTLRSKFVIASSRCTYKVVSLDNVNNCHYILIGIIINQNEDKTVDVLMCNFLMDCFKAVPYNVRKSKVTNFIRKNMYDMYKRYISAFKKRCPDYQQLKDLNISIPRISDISAIAENVNDIFKNFHNIIGDVNFQKFSDRFFDKNNNIMCIHNKILYTFSFDLSKKKSIYTIELPKYTYDFICIFRNIKVSMFPFTDKDVNEPIQISNI